MNVALFDPAALEPREATRRRHHLVTLVVLLAGPGVLVMADLHWRTGFDGWKVAHLLLPKDYVRLRLTGERAMDRED